MFRSRHHLLGYLLPIALAAFCLVPIEASAQMRRVSHREVVNNAAPTLSLTSDTSVIKTCAEGDGQRVRLNAQANSPEGLPIRYKWSTGVGRIVGDGPSVVWDLAGVNPGYYKAYLEIETGTTDAECQAFASTNVLVNACPTIKPVCPAVTVVCPSAVAIDQPLTFTSNVIGGTSTTPSSYAWTVSAGRIIEGQGTPTIKVDTTGLAGETIRATLSMTGFTEDCADTCEVHIPLPQQKCRKFDEFPEISRNDEKARLDNLVVALQNDPTATAYIYVSPGRSGNASEVEKRRDNIVEYLTNSRQIDSRRVITQRGAERDALMIEIWVCPQGVTPPRP